MIEPAGLALFLFALNTFYHALAWRILFAGRRTADGVFAAALIFSFGTLFAGPAVMYFPFFEPFFFCTLLILQASFLGYLYAFPNAVWPPFRLIALVLLCGAALMLLFTADPNHATQGTAAATLFFMLVSAYLAVRKQRHLSAGIRRTTNAALAVISLPPLLLGSGAAISLAGLNTVPFFAAILVSSASIGLLLLLSQRVSRDIPLSRVFVATIAVITLIVSPLWLQIFPLRVIIARSLPAESFFLHTLAAAVVTMHLLSLAILWAAGHAYRLLFLRQTVIERTVDSFRTRATAASDHRGLLNAFDEAMRQMFPPASEIRYIVFSPDESRLAELGKKRQIDPALEQDIVAEWFIENEESFLFARAAPSGLLEEACARIGADIVIPLRDSGMLFGLIAIRAPKANAALARAAALMTAVAMDHYTRLSLINLVVQKERLLREAQYFAETDKMVSVIAHEVRTPLTAIMFNLEVLAEALRKGNPCDPEYLDIARRELKRINETAEKMLLFGRDIKLEPADGLFETFVAELAQTYAASPIPVRFECSPGLAAHLDWERLRHVVINLVNNAVQAVEEVSKGTVTVSIGEDAGLIRIAVRDTGPGIPAEVRERIFDPFFTTKRDGNGLGLAICRKIVRLMGGTIELTSSRPGETVFTVSVPQST